MKVLFVLLGAIGLVSLNSAAVIQPEDSETPPKAVSFPVGPIGDLEQQTKQNPTDAKAWYQLGIAFDKTGRLDRAIEAYQTAVHINPKMPDAWQELGGDLHLQGENDKAIDAYRMATRVEPASDLAWNGLASLDTQMARLDDAGTALSEGFKVAPQSKRLWNTLGMLRLVQKQFADAAEAFRRATEIDPRYVIAWTNLGAANNGLHNFDETITDETTATGLNPNLAESWNALAIAEESKGQHGACLDALQHSVALKPNQPQAWSFLGHEKVLMGIWQEANDDLAQAVDHLGVTSPEVVACYGEAAAHLQHFDQADKLIAQAQASNSNNASVWQSTGTVRLLEQRFPESMDAFQRAVQLDPKNWRAWDGVAVNNFQLQKYTDAIAACRNASALFPDDRLCWRCAYQCYHALGRTDDAVLAMDHLQLLTSGKSAPLGAVPILPPL
jgi:tetratricopeptide (TPR) repeat protein